MEFKLIERVIELSKDTIWDKAKLEWKIEHISWESRGECICGHPIKEIIRMANKKNDNRIIVGNCCVNKFFDVKDYNKVFSALKNNKINKFMIEDKKHLLTTWEYPFALKMWRKRKFTTKQSYCFEKIRKKIVESYK